MKRGRKAHGTHEKEKERVTGALDVSASDISREDFDKGRNRPGRKKCEEAEEVPWILPSTWNAVKGEY